MMKDEHSVLNLDELFGEAKPVKVRWQGVLHELRRPEALGPRDLVRYDKLMALMAEAQTPAPAPGDGESSENAQAAAIERAIDEMLRMVGPSLLEVTTPLSFMAKNRVLQYYTEQVITPTGPDEKKASVSPASTEPIGAMSSAG
jgi:hypothetical protein